VTAALYAALRAWRAGALLFWLTLAVTVIEVVSHILREPLYERHRRRPAR
jgi:hypothetical protein